MTLQERLRFVERKQGGTRIQDHNRLICEAADALDAKDAKIEELEGALERIEEGLRKAGATLPAPEPTGTIEGAMSAGLCIALCLVVVERERTMGAAVSGGGEPRTTTHFGDALQATHSQECPRHEQKQPLPAINGEDRK